MKPWPLLLVHHGPVRLPLISITLFDSFSYHTPVSLATNDCQSCKWYLFVVILQQKYASIESESCICTIIRAGTHCDEGDDRKGCFLSRQCGRGAMCWCGTWPGAHPCLSARRPLSPIGYKAALLWRAFPASSPASRARYMHEAVTWLPTVTQLENRGWRRASRWVVASRFSGQEALLKNKASLCFGDTGLQGACSVRVWSAGNCFLKSSLTLFN